MRFSVVCEGEMNFPVWVVCFKVPNVACSSAVQRDCPIRLFSEGSRQLKTEILKSARVSSKSAPDYITDLSAAVFILSFFSFLLLYCGFIILFCIFICSFCFLKMCVTFCKLFGG